MTKRPQGYTEPASIFQTKNSIDTSNNTTVCSSLIALISAQSSHHHDYQRELVLEQHEQAEPSTRTTQARCALVLETKQIPCSKKYGWESVYELRLLFHTSCNWLLRVYQGCRTVGIHCRGTIWESWSHSRVTLEIFQQTNCKSRRGRQDSGSGGSSDGDQRQGNTRDKSSQPGTISEKATETQRKERTRTDGKGSRQLRERYVLWKSCNALQLLGSLHLKGSSVDIMRNTNPEARFLAKYCIHIH